jgi:tRNA threonylcarbamoyladenosine biosynthesis protein TsaB
MNRLAIETSTEQLSVAVMARGQVWSHQGPGGAQASAGLLAAVHAVLAQAGLALNDMGVIAMGRGPGSFTGLRVGVTAAKTLAWATGARLVGISGFEVIARRAEHVAGWTDAAIAIAYDAGRGEVWAATASPTRAGWTVTSPALVGRAAWLDGLPAGARVAGPALAAADGVAGRSDLVVPPAEAWHPAAADAAALARGRAEAGLCADPFTLVPDYMRPSYAEEKRGPAGG